MNIEVEKLIRVKANADATRFAISQPIYKEDYGLYLFIEGLDLPEIYTVDFSESETNGTSVSMLGNADGVLIPQQFIKSGKTIYAFLYLAGTEVGKTVYKFKIPNRIRPDRTNEEPTPEQQSVIDQTISALNDAVESAQEAQQAIEDMSVSAQTLAEGSSATVTKSEQDGVVHLEFGIPTGATGAKGERGEKGEKGDRGIQGIQGERGLQGETGPAGPAGPKGDTGSTGPQGPAGPKGDTGSTGPQGPQGDSYVLTAQDKHDIADTVAEELEPTLYDMYPTDTASGAVASFSDGAENIPMKSIRIDTSEISGKVTRSGKNVFDNQFSNRTINGLTWVLNSDGTITVNGTATAETQLHTLFVSYLEGEFYFSGCPSGGSGSSYDVFIWDVTNTSRATQWNRTTLVVSELGEGNAQVYLEKGVTYRFCYRIRNGYTANNVLFSPMIRLASDTDGTYESYNGNTYDVAIADGLVQGEIPTLYGVNSVWSDVGDVEAEYRADPDLYIQRKMPEVPVQDVQINGSSIVTDGVANVPVATSSVFGVTKPGNGLFASGGALTINKAPSNIVKAGTQQYAPIVPYNQHESTFYGLAKSAGDTTQSASSNPVGTYTEEAKTAIRTMLGLEDVYQDYSSALIALGVI